MQYIGFGQTPQAQAMKRYQNAVARD